MARTGVDAMLQSVQAQFPGHRFRRTGKIDAYRGYIRFAWGLGAEGAAALAGGADFGEIVDSRPHAVTGFLDFAPVAAAQ